MKIVQNPNRWLRKLLRAAALIPFAMSTEAAFCQDGPWAFGRTPSGSASEVINSNRNGFGMAFRGGHTAGNTIGRSDSISHIELMPYFNVDNGLLFGDSRLIRANQGELAWSFGGGYRHYLPALDAVLGGNSYFDADQLTGTRLQQWGVGAEILANRWEARGNLYQTFGDTVDLVGQGINQNSIAFSGSNITFTRVDTFAEALRGFDAELGMMLPGDISERFDLRVFGGGYYYESDNIEGFGGWSSRLQSDIGKCLELNLKLTNDRQYDTTVSFAAVVHFGGFSSQEHTTRSAIQRFRDPVRRNLNIVALTSDVGVPGQVATKSDGSPLTIAHVNSNAVGPAFVGTVDDPFQLLTQGLGAGTDIVFVHAGSQFNAAPENMVSLLPDQRLIGEGLIQPGRETLTQLPVSLQGQNFLLTIPHSPTFETSPDLPRPLLTGAAGNSVTMNDRAFLSGFVIQNAAQNGIFSDGFSDVVINDTSVINAGLSGISLQNTVGQTNVTNTNITASTSAAPAFYINGGTGQITYTSNDDFLLAFVDNTSPNPALVIENMTGGRFQMNRSSITDVGGQGVVIQNNTGGLATIDNVSITDSTSTGIAITNSDGDYTFRSTIAKFSPTTITNPALQGILIQNATGSITFSDQIVVSGRQTGGIEIDNSSATVTFSQAVSVIDQSGLGPEDAISIHDLPSTAQVIFRDNININATALGLGSRGNAISIFNNALDSFVTFEGNVAINQTDEASIFIDTVAGDVDFLGITTISNRVLEGIIVNGSSGDITFGTASGDRTEVNNELDSQSAAIQITTNSGTVRFSNAVVVNSQGNPGGGAGIHIVGNQSASNDALVRFTDLDVESIDGVGIFGLDNDHISIDDGFVDTVNAAAINLEESGINIHLETVNSTDSPDYGIRLVETNRDGRKTFVIRPNANFPAPGAGGIITLAKGDGLDNNDAAGIFIQNGGQTEIYDMFLLDNEFGVRIDNTEDPTVSVTDRNEQYFRIVDSLVQDSDIRGIHAHNLVGLEVLNTDFDNNGDDAAEGRETIRVSYDIQLDDSISYDRADRPWEVLIQDSGFVSNMDDVIRIFQTSAAAQDSVIRVRMFDNAFQVNDITDHLANPYPVDPRPLFDDAITIDWFGAARVQIDGNQFNLTAIEQQHVFDLTNGTTIGLTEFSMQNNDSVVTNLGNDPGNVIIDLFGPSVMNDTFFQIANNTTRMTGLSPTAYYLSLRAISDVEFFNNSIRSESDGGTGIEIRRASNNSTFDFTQNLVEFRDLGALDERGIFFTQVGGVVGLSGTRNTMRIISNGFNGNNFIEVPFFIPGNSSFGQVEINGVLFP